MNVHVVICICLCGIFIFFVILLSMNSKFAGYGYRRYWIQMSTIQRECKPFSLLENEQFNSEKSNFLRHLVYGHVLGPCQQFLSHTGTISCLHGLN